MRKDEIEDFFSSGLKTVQEDSELFILLRQKVDNEEKTLFDAIKENLLKHVEFYGKNPNNWNDQGFHYGHVAILCNKETKKFAKKDFEFLYFKVKIYVGLIRDLPYGKGMRLTWKMMI